MLASNKLHANHLAQQEIRMDLGSVNSDGVVFMCPSFPHHDQEYAIFLL